MKVSCKNSSRALNKETKQTSQPSIHVRCGIYRELMTGPSSTQNPKQSWHFRKLLILKHFDAVLNGGNSSELNHKLCPLNLDIKGANSTMNLDNSGYDWPTPSNKQSKRYGMMFRIFIFKKIPSYFEFTWQLKSNRLTKQYINRSANKLV